MAKVERDRGSNQLGAIVIASVFGPMAILAVLWAGAVGVGESGSTRDAFGNAMMFVLLAAGAVMIIEELILAVLMTFGHSHIDWPRPAAGGERAPAEPGKDTTPSPHN